MSKLPQITLYFWIMKICATTLGETAGDQLSMTMQIGYGLTFIILIGLFAAALTVQLMAKTYHPFLYWGVILLTSTAGTEMSDYMDRTLELGYAKGALILLALLMTIFGFWRLSGRSFSVEHIKTLQDEMLYWAAILVSNTLGTAMGDYLADDSGLGFGGGALLIGGLLALTIAAKFWTRISGTLLFWVAFILTRPFGATLGDFLTKPLDKGGLDFGTAGASGILAGVLILFILVRGRKADACPGATGAD